MQTLWVPFEKFSKIHFMASFSKISQAAALLVLIGNFMKNVHLNEYPIEFSLQRFTFILKIS